MAIGFAQPFMSRLGPIAQRAAAALPQPLAAPKPMDLSPAAKFPSLPQTAPAQSPAPAPVEAAPAAPPADPAALGPEAAAAGDVDITALLAAIFGA